MSGIFRILNSSRFGIAPGLTIASLSAIGLYCAALQLTGNFHVISAGEAYRSAQPTAAAILADSKEYGIKTIVNLRGASPHARWYKAEKREASKLGITLVNFAMHASKELTQAQTSHLVSILKNAQKPILIHCKAGADRSGLASALYLAAIDKVGETIAGEQISLRYGHFSLPFTAAYAMDKTWASLERSSAFANS